MEIRTISPQEFQKQSAEGEPVHLIDVRTPAEFEEIHASPARNIPLERLNPAKLELAPDERIIFICKSGARGRQACEKFISAGFLNVSNVAGGTDTWSRDGLPVVRGRKTISLERQVRIAAGSIVLIGAALAFLVHPAFAGISAFVGAGLVFAGITDTCGMAMLLARMPWNQKQD